MFLLDKRCDCYGCLHILAVTIVMDDYSRVLAKFQSFMFKGSDEGCNVVIADLIYFMARQLYSIALIDHQRCISFSLVPEDFLLFGCTIALKKVLFYFHYSRQSMQKHLTKQCFICSYEICLPSFTHSNNKTESIEVVQRLVLSM